MKKHYIILLFSIVFFGLVSCVFIKPKANKLYHRALKKNAVYDAAIVPGVPFVEPAWDNIMQMRVIWAVHLYKRGLVKNLIMSGSAVYSPYSEAKIMRLYAIALGVPTEHILLEEKAEHSTENLWFGYKLAIQNGLQTVALASDPFQTKLLLRFGKKRTPELAYLPVLFDTLRMIPHDTPVINYKNIRLDPFIPLPQRESPRERWRGTRGKHIQFND
jgi:uncharacterized SAM-binding protein YcdF (DUF218 family)